MRLKLVIAAMVALVGCAHAQRQPLNPPTPFAAFIQYVNGEVDNIYQEFIPIPPDNGDGVWVWDGVAEMYTWSEFDSTFYYDPLSNKVKLDPAQISYLDLANKPSLGTAAAQNVGYFATAAQGTKADNAAVASDVTTALSTKVDVVAGKGLSANDYSSAEKSKLAGIAAGATANSSDATLLSRANHTGTQAISTIVNLQSSLDSKEGAITAGSAGQYFAWDKTWKTLDKSAVGLSNVDNTSDANKPVSSAVTTALAAKFNTPAGTTSQYLRGDGSLATFPTVPAAQIQSDWSQVNTSAADYVKNKPATYAPSAHTHVATEISDSTTVGRSVLTASSAANARTAIGAGTSSFSGAWVDLTGKPGVATTSVDGLMSAADKTKLDGLTGATSIPAGVTRAINSTSFQPSTTRNTDANYSIKLSTTVTLLAGSQTVGAELQISANGSTGWYRAGYIENSQTLGVSISVSVTDAPTVQLIGKIPAGYYARIVTSGTGTATWVSGVETPY